ncbi:uncharacterized protein LOC121987886 [Zingiber officinale]|uniref:GRF-type domain-containing protein n=1 Tax=Zingiber officinale TaxID=94328 RepID=A0A8J5GFC9_ZINOF|nr:uncharacterized protein LOC121987886 [Zingiber officinale]KAG6505366.1 hypothetical protein ZIOFF_037722 [Zingiber officinale]
MNDEQCEAPHILCYCGLRAILQISWTESNPGRRFFSCPKYRERGCDFFLWHDPEPSQRSKTIINELKWNNKKLKLEISELKKCASYNGEVDYNDVLDDGNNNYATMQLNDEISSLNRKFRVAIMVIVCTWIVMMWMWLM